MPHLSGQDEEFALVQLPALVHAFELQAQNDQGKRGREGALLSLGRLFARLLCGGLGGKTGTQLRNLLSGSVEKRGEGKRDQPP